MTILAKSATFAVVTALTLGVATASTTTTAEAGSRDAAIAAGVGGFVAGTLLGAAVAQPRYVAPAPVVVYEEPVYVRRGGGVTPAGVSVHHARNCAARFRSYDWNTNTYVTYSGRVRYC